ncbi:hypothetical protein [Achromobacter aegrifaciens]|nr:hypothetical protein [Achromobacter aegrifaciens]
MTMHPLAPLQGGYSFRSELRLDSWPDSTPGPAASQHKAVVR